METCFSITKIIDRGSTMNMPEKKGIGNGNKNKRALAMAFGVGLLTGAGGSEVASLIITKDYCCVGDSCKCRWECRNNETNRGGC